VFTQILDTATHRQTDTHTYTQTCSTIITVFTQTLDTATHTDRHTYIHTDM